MRVRLIPYLLRSIFINFVNSKSGVRELARRYMSINYIFIFFSYKYTTRFSELPSMIEYLNVPTLLQWAYLCVRCRSFLQSAHCLRMDPLWYSAYSIGAPAVDYR